MLLYNFLMLILQLEHPGHANVLCKLSFKGGGLPARADELAKLVKPVDHL